MLKSSESALQRVSSGREETKYTKTQSDREGSYQMRTESAEGFGHSWMNMQSGEVRIR